MRATIRPPSPASRSSSRSHSRRRSAAQPAATLSDPVAMAIAAELDSLMGPEPAPIHGVQHRAAGTDPVVLRAARLPARPGAMRRMPRTCAARSPTAPPTGSIPRTTSSPLLDAPRAASSSGPAATPTCCARSTTSCTPRRCCGSATTCRSARSTPRASIAQWNFGRTLDDRDVARQDRAGARHAGHLPAHRGAEADAPHVRSG